MPDSLGVAADLVELPDGAVPESAVTVVSFLDEQGNSMIAYRAHGNPQLASAVGLLNMAAYGLMRGEDE